MRARFFLLCSFFIYLSLSPAYTQGSFVSIYLSSTMVHILYTTNLLHLHNVCAVVVYINTVLYTPKFEYEHKPLSLSHCVLPIGALFPEKIKTKNFLQKQILLLTSKLDEKYALNCTIFTYDFHFKPTWPRK